ncbi:MAG: aspartate--tRNA ligase [Bacillota bacterium]|nr:aspartate--tRNA ligase [Bacillota bacterium]
MDYSTSLRTHTCGGLNRNNIGEKVKIAGWIANIRDHGGVIFLDLRDQYGVTQVVVGDDSILSQISKEAVVSAQGIVSERDPETYNPKIATGEVEITSAEITLLGGIYNQLPFEIQTSRETKEDIRLKYRFLDLRNEKVYGNILKRSKIIAFLRNKMEELNFTEIQTPILSASSPEGARDYLVPSRKYKGQFYALPQAPQQFKQLLMVSGIDKYFQIAPCFRDEDARADRSPGEFYQLDFEMAFASQEDVFAVAEEVLSETFEKFAPAGAVVDKAPFVRISYREAMLKYGTDKPDLRNPLFIIDVSDIFTRCEFGPFKGKIVRAIRMPDGAKQSKGFFEKMLDFATGIGMKGLGYVKVEEDMSLAGPIAKFMPRPEQEELIEKSEIKPGDILYFISDAPGKVEKYAGEIRTELANRLGLIDETQYKFCFIVDFPMYERDEETGKIIFTHNPFSMPQGGMDALLNKDPLEVLAYQYDIVVNGVELSSGAVRNHVPEIMVKAFEIAGYTEEDVKSKFTSLYTAFHYGAPPHAGMAPGVDRMVMLLTEEKSIREVIAFPMNGAAQDMLLGAPSEVTEQQLREVHIKIR